MAEIIKQLLIRILAASYDAKSARKESITRGLFGQGIPYERRGEITCLLTVGLLCFWPCQKWSQSPYCLNRC